MIKINLLAIRKEKKKIKIRKEFLVLIPALVLEFAFIGFMEWKMDKEKAELLESISKAKKENDYYKSLMTEVKKAKESQKILQDKLNVINSLRKQKAVPARVLDEISMNKPDKIQLDSLKKEGAKLGIEGLALDDETVANFMTNLRRSKVFKSVDLIVTEQVEQSKFKLKKFILSCEIS
ncbi:MAG: PilN domain-containing protein [Syntrophaceae bacterium]|nr:PilN domain-containing protein [Syntrophaceae bacterium]